MATYLVTGGAGFIGSHLVEELLRRGERVRILDNFSTGRRENLPPGDACDLVEGDVADPAIAVRAVAGCDFVLHQGAIPSVPRSIKEPLATHRANIDGTVNILVAARDAGVKRVVFAGSSSVYGNSAVLPKREDMRPSPLTPYALQKLVGEQYCQLFTQLYGLETVVTRYFNVFGPRQQPGSPYSGVISLFIEALATNTAPTVYGDGRQTRDFTYVGDVVNGVLRACTAPKASGEVINVAAGGRVSLLELIRALQHILGTNVEPVFKPSREGDVHDSQADIFKARQLLSFEPSTLFEDGLRKTVDWYQRARSAAGSRV
ncbi:MAG TPA: SDR family oxidoreductase [Vicinamibacterales bacterium]|nr:SDR family oxidoreductase [Vicinamibacterales bacterium]